jgi:hypothetical protein
MRRSLVLDVFVLFFEKPKDIWILPTVALNFSVTIPYSMIDRFIVSSVCKRPKSARPSHHISKPNAINGVEREIIVDNPAKALAEE